MKLDTHKLYTALTKAARHQHISLREVARRSGIGGPNTLIRLKQGYDISANTLIRLLTWLGHPHTDYALPDSDNTTTTLRQYTWSIRLAWTDDDHDSRLTNNPNAPPETYCDATIEEITIGTWLTARYVGTSQWKLHIGGIDLCVTTDPDGAPEAVDVYRFPHGIDEAAHTLTWNTEDGKAVNK